MSDLSNSSFIPKQGPVKKRRRSASKKVYFFSLICYIAFFSSLLGVGGVYFYSDYVNKQFEVEVVALRDETSSFSEANMRRVQEFDMRLKQANERLNNSASVVSIFNLLEAATIETVALESMTLEREDDDVFDITVNVETDSFDSTIFQRQVYQDSESVGSISIESLQSSGLAETDSEEGNNESNVVFIAEMTIPLEAVPYVPRLQPDAVSSPETPVSEIIPSPETSDETGTIGEEANQIES